MNSARMGNRVGILHFIRFPTTEMDNFLLLAKSKGFASLSSTVCATGGGAFKFEADFIKVLIYLFMFKLLYYLSYYLFLTSRIDIFLYILKI